MDAEAKRRQAIKRDAALFDSLGIPRPPDGAARAGLTCTVRFDEGDEGAARGREVLQRGKSLLSPWPAWQGEFPRRPEEVPVRGIQPGRCCRCGGQGRIVLFKEPDGECRRAMDWCGAGRCDREQEAPVVEPAPALPDPVAGLPAVGPVAAPDPVVKAAA